MLLTSFKQTSCTCSPVLVPSLLKRSIPMQIGGNCEAPFMYYLSYNFPSLGYKHSCSIFFSNAPVFVLSSEQKTKLSASCESVNDAVSTAAQTTLCQVVWFKNWKGYRRKPPWHNWTYFLGIAYKNRGKFRTTSGYQTPGRDLNLKASGRQSRITNQSNMMFFGCKVFKQHVNVK